jgi:diguanylate cyclase (GGDEF)-like protein
LYLNVAATFLILDSALQYKNRLVARLYVLLARVESLSSTDPLTDIPNRRAFIERATMALAHSRRHGEPFSIAYIDVDNFKQVNDNLGHAAGDQLLRVVASAIRTELRSDDMVARLGGDEFGIIFTHAPQGIKQHVDRIKQALDNHCPHEHAYQAIGFSIGVVHYDGTLQATTDELICCADRLMYEIKKSSKNGVRFGMYSQQTLAND